MSKRNIFKFQDVSCSKNDLWDENTLSINTLGLVILLNRSRSIGIIDTEESPDLEHCDNIWIYFGETNVN